MKIIKERTFSCNFKQGGMELPATNIYISADIDN